MKKLSLALTAVSVFALTGCAATNSYLADRHSTVEMYHIFDIQTVADTKSVVRAASEGLGQNSNQINENTPLQMGKIVPDAPGRFTITDMTAKLAGTGMGAMMQLASMQGGGVSMKMANCDGAVWTARAQRTVSGSSNLNLYGCLYKYKAGYHLDTYAVFQKTEGGLYQVSRDIANSIVGTPEAWVNKTVMDMVRSIESRANAKVTHVEGQPELGEEPSITKVSKQ